VLGRFDGLPLGYKLTDWMTLNGVTGFPVANTDNKVEAECSSQQLDEDNSDTSSYFLNLGYRYDF
jgi:hypothetical protein